MVRFIAYAAVLATIIFVQSSEAGITTISLQKVPRKKEQAICHDSTTYDYNEIVYIGELSIGTPPQNFQMKFGTGTMGIWVPDYKVGQHAYYNSVASSTYIKNGTDYLIKYGDNSIVKGYLSVDTMHCGSLTFPNQKFMEVSDASGFKGYEDLSFDGIVGMALDMEGPYKLPSPVEKLAMEGQLDKPEFAFYFGDNGSPELTIGGVKTTHYVGDFKYVPVLVAGPWWIEMDLVVLGTTLIARDPSAVAMDSGSQFFSAPPSQLAMIVKQLGATQTSDGKYTIDCTSTGPTLDFLLGGYTYKFEKTDYMVKISEDKCVLAIEDSGYDDVWYFGTIFMKKYYTVFDYGTKATGVRVGFAQAV